MKIVMTLLVRDEEDIVGANIEYHLARGVDMVIAMDNRSEDDTRRILESYARRGVLRYLYQPGDDYDQGTWVTRMARMAFTDYAADWVINNDADEFWWPVKGDLRDTFQNVPATVNVLEACRYNFVPVDDQTPFFDTMIYRETTSLNPLGKPLPPKVAHRGTAEVVVAQGNHSVDGLDSPRISAGAIEILHFPVRSYEQVVNKIGKGGAAYERNTRLPRGMGATWRTLYRQLQTDGNLHGYFSGIHHDPARLAHRLQNGELVTDRRLSQYFAQRVNP